MSSENEKMQARLEAQARRAAKAAGLLAKKSRRRAGTFDNQGGFTLLDLTTNYTVAGERCDLTAEDVVRIVRRLSSGS